MTKGSRSTTLVRNGPFPLDIVPRIITADEWSVVERGVAQWWVGDWWAYDPTNDAVPGTGYVVVARDATTER